MNNKYIFSTSAFFIKRLFVVFAISCSIFILQTLAQYKTNLAPSAITYSSQSTATFPAPQFSARTIEGDFDNDGDTDILYQTGGNGTAFQYARSNGDGTFTILSQASSPFSGVTLIDTAGLHYNVGDYDGDGDDDIFAIVQNTTGKLYRNDGGVFSDQSNGTIPAPAFTRSTVGDFDNDGDTDILYQTGANGTAFQYARSNGDGTFTILSQASSPFSGVTLIDNSGTNYNVGDFDGDGDVDVWAVIQNTTGNYYRNDGGGSFSTQSSATFPAPAFTRTTAGDFDSDGDTDILYQTGGNGTAFQYARSNGDGTFTILSQASSPFSGVTLVDNNGFNYNAGDYDGDTDIDVWASANAATGNFYRQNDRPPTVVSSNPADNATGVPLSANIELTFNESVSKGTGNLYIVRVSDSTVVETIAVGSSQVSGAGTTWTIDPSITFAANTEYALRADRRIFADADGAIFFGIGNNTTLNFTTTAPTAANVMISGRVLTQNGRGLSRVSVTLTDSEGNIRYARTNPFGNYRFTDVEVGTYVISASSKEYNFVQDTMLLSVDNNLTEVNFLTAP